MDIFEKRFKIARRAAVEYIGRTIDLDRFNYDDLDAYADSLAESLVRGIGGRDHVVNGMRYVSGPTFDYVAFDD